MPRTRKTRTHTPTHFVNGSIITEFPALRIAPPMHAGNYHNAMGFHLEEQAVREPLYSRPPQLVMHGLKAQGTLCDYLYRRIHSQRKPQAKVRVNAFVPREGFL